jgi:hypothetical protein
MGYFQRERERIKISKEEYEKNAYKRKDDSLKERMKEMFLNSDFLREPIYKNSGLLAMLDPNEIIGYKYYKLGKEKLVYICGSKEYDYLKNNNII